MTNAVTLVRPGDVIAGRYRTERIIGEGAMGLVVEATDLKVERRVAIKLMRQDSRRHPDLVERFVREALIAGELRSEHAVRVEEVGKLACGQVYLVMELLEGEDLAAKLRREGRLEVAEALKISLQVAHALTAAHDAGIVHRDVKPANVFMAEGTNGPTTAKLLDFGLSKLQRAVQCAMPTASLTAPQMRLGTMPYMAPEQWLCSKDVDGRVDVWALGVVLYELLTGTLPFKAKGPVQLMQKIFHDEPVALCEHRPDVPAAVAELVNHCLTKSVTDRCASMRELVEVLERLVVGAEARQQDGTAATLAAVALQAQTGRRTSAGAMGRADTMPAPTLEIEPLTFWRESITLVRQPVETESSSRGPAPPRLELLQWAAKSWLSGSSSGVPAAHGGSQLPLGAAALGGLFGSIFGEDLSLAPEALARLPSA